VSDVIVAPQVRDLEDLAGRIGGWIQGRLPEAKDICVEKLAYPKGAGQSHETILFDLSWTAGGRRQQQGWVVRIKPTSFTMFPDDLFDRQYKILEALHAQGNVRVARPLGFEPDPTVLGAPFFVMEKVSGRVAVSIPPYVQSGWVAEATADQRARMWDAGVRQLAAIQKTPVASVDFLAGPAHARSGLAQEWDKYRRFVEWVSGEQRFRPLDAAVEQLERSWPKNQPEGVVWGDARLGNMMFGDDFDVVAVMDWEQPSLGGALQDLAWWLVNARMMHCDAEGHPRLAGFGARAETVALWRAETGVSTDDLEWYEAFANLKFACLGIRMASLRGAPLPDEASLARRLNVQLTA
jgi:aminoglycoside phosphotransferase (APT) family kinase protein